jgi:hypothetical protein
MYIIFNPGFPIYSRLIDQAICFGVFIAGLLIPYVMLNKNLPNIFKFSAYFIPIFMISAFLNFNNDWNYYWEDKSIYVLSFEILYAITIIKLIYDKKWKSSIIIGLSSVAFYALLLPFVIILESIIENWAKRLI